MLYRTRSYPGGLSQKSRQNPFRSERNLAQLARFSDPYGPHVPRPTSRVDALGSNEQPLSKGKQSSSTQTAYKLLTKPRSEPLNQSRREFPTKRDSTSEQVQIAPVPASLDYKESSCKESYRYFQSNVLQLEKTSLQCALKLALHERNDESYSNNCGVPRELIHLQVGKDDRLPRSTEDSLKIRSTDQPARTESVQTREGTPLRKLWTKKKEKRRLGSLVLLNVLAALYGSSNVANGLVADAAPSLPVSLTSLVRFTSALLFFGPALWSALTHRDKELLRAGAELGGLAFAATVVDSCNPTTGSSSSAALLFAFTVVLIPIMELFAGRRSSSTLTRFATLAAISGMGLLEEEGFGWKGISCPQIGDLWGIAVSVISALHIFRSEAHCGRFDPLRLNAVQCGVLAILSLGWETLTTFDPNAFQAHDILNQVQSLPWAPLIYNGLVCFGLCSWLELHGLRSLHASTATLVYTTIPVWGAFLSYYAHHETPVESAVIGGLVIMATSIYAQMTTTKADVAHLRDRKRASPSRGPNSKSDAVEVSMPNVSTTDHVLETNDEPTGNETRHDVGNFPGALLTSQLKFPYYAAQAKRLLADLKMKLGAIKALLLTTASSGIVTSTTGTTSPQGTTPGGNPASGSVSVGGPTTLANINAGNSLHGGTSTSSSVVSHIAKVDVSTTQHVAPHGPVSSLSSDLVSEAMKGSHASADLTHFFTALLTVLESALVVVGSDIMVGCEEAEDAATLLERFMQAAAENTAHTVGACVAGGTTWLESTSSNFVESAARIPQGLASGDSTALPFPSHVAESIADSLMQHLLPFLHHIQ